WPESAQLTPTRHFQCHSIARAHASAQPTSCWLQRIHSGTESVGPPQRLQLRSERVWWGASMKSPDRSTTSPVTLILQVICLFPPTILSMTLKVDLLPL